MNDVKKDFLQVISLDIETTGRDENTCQLLELAAIYDAPIKSPLLIPELPTFVATFWNSKIVGEHVAISMNAELISTIHHQKVRLKSPNVYDLSVKEDKQRFVDNFSAFIQKNVYPDVGLSLLGKNIHFDLKFINHIFGEDFIGGFNFSHRYIDVGNLLFDPKIHTGIPSSQECHKILGMGDVKHRAVSDARTAILALRSKTHSN